MNHWHQIRFKLVNHDDDFLPERIAHPDSALHYAIANEILAPLLNKYEKGILLWRIHRIRVAEGVYKINGVDQTPQHSFKLKLFCSPYLATRRFYPAVKYHSLIAELRELHLLDELGIGCTDGKEEKDDHDKEWPLSLKEAWPYYINGVSRMWLVMLQFYCEQILVEWEIKDFSKQDLWTRICLYKEISTRMKAVWRTWAKHSLFHHASILFGNNWSYGVFSPYTVEVTKPRKGLSKILGKYEEELINSYSHLSIRF